MLITGSWKTDELFFFFFKLVQSAIYTLKHKYKFVALLAIEASCYWFWILIKKKII